MTVNSRFDRLGTAAKLLLALSLVLFPIGGLLVWSALHDFKDVRSTIAATARQRAELSATSLESLIARNALALRVAANAALNESRSSTACEEAAATLAIAPPWRAGSRSSSGAASPFVRSATSPTL